jgi:hypothetical protein
VKFIHIAENGRHGLRVEVRSRQGGMVSFVGPATERSQHPHAGQEERRYEVFTDINDYIAMLPSHIQDDMFEQYVIMREILDTPNTVGSLVAQLQPHMAAVIDSLNLRSIRQFLTLYQRTSVPSTVKDQFLGEAQAGTAAQTWLREEYLDLVALSTMLRVAYPIFIEFSQLASASLGSDRRDTEVFRLIEKSHLINQGDMHPAIQRLMVYVYGCLDKKPTSDLHRTFTAGPSGDLAPTIAATLLVRKIACADIRGLSESSSIVSVMWQTVRGILTGSRNESSRERVTPKKPMGEGKNGGEGQEGSRFETSRAGSRLAIDTVVIMTHPARDVYSLARAARPDIDLSLVELLDKTNQAMKGKIAIQDCQVGLARLVLNEAVSPLVYDYMDRDMITNCLTAAQAVLWQHGDSDFKVLAAMIAGSTVDMGAQTITLSSSTTARSRVDNDTIWRLCQAYSSITPVNLSTEEAQIKAFRTGPVMSCVSRLAAQFLTHDWVAHLPGPMLAQVTGSATNARLEIQPEMVSILCKVLLELVTK